MSPEPLPVAPLRALHTTMYLFTFSLIVVHSSADYRTGIKNVRMPFRNLVQKKREERVKRKGKERNKSYTLPWVIAALRRVRSCPLIMSMTRGIPVRLWVLNLKFFEMVTPALF